MRIFVTGASGFVGSAVVQELLSAGHGVLGLARSEASAQKLATLGVEVFRGNLEDPESLGRAAARADGVIHTAFNHDFSKFQANCEQDRRVILALGEALAGSARPLLITSGIGVLPPQDDLPTEKTRIDGGVTDIPRAASEQAAHSLAVRGINVSIVRLPPSVHGDGDHGFVPLLIGMARQQGKSAYIGTGANRWSAVHRLDAARAYRLILERAEAASTWHLVAEEDIAFRDIATAIGKGLGLPTAGCNQEEAGAHFGWFAHFAARDMAASSHHTQSALGWTPTRPGLREDLAHGTYFSVP